MKFFRNKNVGFTLTELVVGIFITSILTVGVFYFISDTIEHIAETNAKIDFLNELNAYVEEVSEISNTHIFGDLLDNKYEFGNIIVDNETGTGSDIFLYHDNHGGGTLLGVINKETLLIETGSTAYNSYYDKVLATAKISTGQVLAMENDINYVYSIPFQKTDIYKNLRVKDMQMELYSSGVLNIDLSIFYDYKKEYDGMGWEVLDKEYILKTNLNF